MSDRNFSNNSRMTEYTDQVLLIPNTRGIVNNLGIFEREAVSQHNITFERSEEADGVIEDTVRGNRGTVGADDTVVMHNYLIPHFALDDKITVDDVQGVRRTGTAGQEETLANARMKKLEKFRRKHAQTLEKALVEAIKGKIYAPNSTVPNAKTLYDDFGITQSTVNYDFATPSNSMVEKGEAAIQLVQDNVQNGEVVEEVIALCDTGFFSSLVSHASTAEAYKHYTNSNQGGKQVLRDRLGTGLSRTFEHGGVTYIEYRGNGVIEADTAYAFPMGVEDMFKVYNSPAHKLSHANTLGEELYVFEYEDAHDEGWDLQSEQSVLAICKRPEAVVKLTA